MREISVFSRPGCHLCDEAVELIEPLCRAAGVPLRVLNVDSRDEWRQRYGLRIPVVCGSGEELSAWPLDRARIVDWLQGRG